eukprot:s72_g7.t1
MGQQQYLSTIRQQARGYARAGEDTDQPDDVYMDVSESAEEEDSEHDGPAQLNESLAQSEYADAADIQRSVLLILDNLPTGGMANQATRSRVFHEISANFAAMALRAECNSANPMNIARFRSYEELFRGRA